VKLIHTCYRITDPERSLAFYEALGFEKRRELPIRDEAVNYFLGIPGHEQPELELTHNFGVDSYELGTAYGHIAVTVDDMEEALSALAEKGIEPEKPPYSVREGGCLSPSSATRTEAAYWQIETDPAAHRFPVRPLDNWVAVGCRHESAMQVRHRANLAPERRQALVDGNPVRVGRRY
jgi:lactoylglutathione lyase